VQTQTDSPLRRIRPTSGRSRVVALFVLAVLVAGACGSDKPEVASETIPSTTQAPTSCDPSLEEYPHHVVFTKNPNQPGAIAVYANPGDPAPMQTFDNPRKTDSDPPLDVALSFLAIEEPMTNDCDWIKVMLPIRPNGSTGWVKRDDVQVRGQMFRIEVTLSAFNLKAYKGDELILDAPIGVAVADRPTPPGSYYTTELLKSADPVYGPYAFGLSGFSEVLSSFNGGQGQLGLHGTNRPELVGTQVSNGCIRLKNEDILALVAAVGDTTQGIPVQVFA
jgi:hypothetical protein